MARRPGRWRVALAVGGALVLGACGAGEEPCGLPITAPDDDLGAGGRDQLVDRTWILDVERTGEVPVGPGDAVSLFFGDERLDGVNVCNAFGGEYGVRGNVLTVRETTSTRQRCDNAELADAVDDLFEGSSTFLIDGDVLVLRGARDEPNLYFVELPPDDEVDQALLEGTWEVVPVGGGPAAPVPVTFAADGAYDVVVGCARYTGRWQVDRGRLAWPGTGSTDRHACTTAPEGLAEVPADEALLAAALDAAHVHEGGRGLDVLDASGRAIATLRRPGT